MKWQQLKGPAIWISGLACLALIVFLVSSLERPEKAVVAMTPGPVVVSEPPVRDGSVASPPSEVALGEMPPGEVSAAELPPGLMGNPRMGLGTPPPTGMGLRTPPSVVGAPPMAVPRLGPGGAGAVRPPRPGGVTPAESAPVEIVQNEDVGYIDPSVTGADRALLSAYMRNMEPKFRENVVIFTEDGRMIANRPELARGNIKYEWHEDKQAFLDEKGNEFIVPSGSMSRLNLEPIGPITIDEEVQLSYIQLPLIVSGANFSVGFDRILFNQAGVGLSMLDREANALVPDPSVFLLGLKDGTFPVARRVSDEYPAYGDREIRRDRPVRYVVTPSGELRASLGFQLMNGSQIIAKDSSGDTFHPHHDLIIGGDMRLTHRPQLDNNELDFVIVSDTGEVPLQFPEGFRFDGGWDTQLAFAWSEEDFIIGTIRGTLPGRDDIEFYSIRWRMDGSYEPLPDTMEPIENLNGEQSTVNWLTYISANSNGTIVSIAGLEGEFGAKLARSFIVLWKDGKTTVLPYPKVYSEIAVGLRSSQELGAGPYAIRGTVLGDLSTPAQPSIDEEENVAAIFRGSEFNSWRPYLWTDGKWIDVYAELGLTGRCSRFELMRTGRAALLQIGGSRNYIVRF